MKIIIFLSILLISSAHAYVHTKTSSGKNVKWNVSNNDVELLINVNRKGYNSPALSNSEVQEIISDSIYEWNNASSFKIQPTFVDETPVIGESQTLSFTTNAAYFGSGTLAITSLSYDSTSGEVLSGDILLNESLFNSVFFTDNPSVSSGNNAYLGDVITHELGHFVGLAHSEAPGASMNFSIFKDMYTLHSDDIYGVRKIYGDTSGGMIHGKVVGQELNPVFGANVHLISHSTGKVITNVLSESDGSFHFYGLPDDKYVVFINPIKSKSNLPQFYNSASTNFCNGDYVPSFYTKCGGREKGRPQVISVSGQNIVDIGYATIRCDSSHDPEYLRLKQDAFLTESYKIRETSDPAYAGQTFYGIFYKNEIENGTPGIMDKFEIDLRDVDNSLGSYYLDLKFLVESIGSAVKFDITIKRQDTAATSYLAAKNPVSQEWELDMIARHPLSTTSSNNIFEVTVTPYKISSTQKVEIYGTSSLLINKQYYYGILQGLGQWNGSSFDLVSSKNHTNLEDNYSCTEGNVGKTTKGYISASPVSNLNGDGVQTQVVSCATVDFDSNDGPPWGGLGSFVIGFILIFLSRIKRHIPSILLS